jgi:hypothetical protein
MWYNEANFLLIKINILMIKILFKSTEIHLYLIYKDGRIFLNIVLNCYLIRKKQSEILNILK